MKGCLSFVLIFVIVVWYFGSPNDTDHTSSKSASSSSAKPQKKEPAKPIKTPVKKKPVKQVKKEPPEPPKIYCNQDYFEKTLWWWSFCLCENVYKQPECTSISSVFKVPRQRDAAQMILDSLHYNTGDTKISRHSFEQEAKRHGHTLRQRRKKHLRRYSPQD